MAAASTPPDGFSPVGGGTARQDGERRVERSRDRFAGQLAESLMREAALREKLEVERRILYYVSSWVLRIGIEPGLGDWDLKGICARLEPVMKAFEKEGEEHA